MGLIVVSRGIDEVAIMAGSWGVTLAAIPHGLPPTLGGARGGTPWLDWFLGCLDRAFDAAETILESVFKKARFWEKFAAAKLNDRQRKVINRLRDGGFEGKLRSSKWAALTKSSQDTALRDIDDLVRQGILVKEPGGGRSTSYLLSDV